MPIINRIAEYHDEMTAWRRELHQHPEIAFNEIWTSDFIAERLKEFGVDEIHRGIAKTGIVAVIKGQEDNGKGIGLRADMDALPIEEENDIEYKSRNPGLMHACGHDGHSTMLLGAAKYLAETRNFDGTVHLIFQPAEEVEGGAEIMVKEGLFERFKIDSVYGVHNRPGMEVGKMCMRSGPTMAGFDLFDINIQGYGAHGARPQASIDPIVVQAHIVTALQTIASRTVDPLEGVVVSVTQVSSGNNYNVIPDTAHLGGTVRCFSKEVQDTTEETMRRLCENIGTAFGAKITVNYERRYPPLHNRSDQIDLVASIAADVVGADNVDTDSAAIMASEDFSFMLQERPGCFVNLGNGVGSVGGCTVHNPGYDFNDAALPYGATYWARLVETLMEREA